MAYDKQTWVDHDSRYPITAARMGHIEDGIDDLDSRLGAISVFADLTADGATDDTSALNVARDLAGAGGTVWLPAGTIILDNFSPLENQLYIGAGLSKTVLKAKTGAARVVNIQGRFLSKFQNLTVDGRAMASVGIRIRGDNSGNGTSQRNMLERVRVTQCSTGVLVDGTGASDQADKNVFLQLLIDNCTTGFETATSNSQQQCFIGGSIDDVTTTAIKAGGGTFSFIGWQAQQTGGGAGVTLMLFNGGNVDDVVMIDCITETHDIGFDAGPGHNWPLMPVQLYGCVIQVNTHIAKIDRAGTPVALITRGCRLNGGTVQLLGTDSVFVEEHNAPAGTSTVTFTGASTRHLKEGFNNQQAATVASAGTITAPAGATLLKITGTTAINTISTTNAWDGRELTLKFASTASLTEAGNCLLAGAFAATADDTITVVYDAATGGWYEKCRSVN